MDRISKSFLRGDVWSLEEVGIAEAAPGEASCGYRFIAGVILEKIPGHQQALRGLAAIEKAMETKATASVAEAKEDKASPAPLQQPGSQATELETEQQVEKTSPGTADPDRLPVEKPLPEAPNTSENERVEFNGKLLGLLALLIAAVLGGGVPCSVRKNELIVLFKSKRYLTGT